MKIPSRVAVLPCMSDGDVVVGSYHTSYQYLGNKKYAFEDYLILIVYGLEN